MKDCESCEFSVKNNPEMAGKDFYDTPCASCRIREPFETEPKTLAQIKYVETRSKETLGTGFLDMGEHELPSADASKLSRKAQTIPFDVWQAAWMFADSTTYSEQQFLFSAVNRFTKPEWALIHAAHRRGFTVSQTTLARELGITKQAVNATIDSLCKKVPSMSALMQKQKRGKK